MFAPRQQSPNATRPTRPAFSTALRTLATRWRNSPVEIASPAMPKFTGVDCCTNISNTDSMFIERLHEKRPTPPTASENGNLKAHRYAEPMHFIERDISFAHS